MNLYKSDAYGKMCKSSVNTGGRPLVHDFVLAGQYLVFFIPPVRMNPLLVLSGLSSFSDALEWKPSKGTQFRCRSRNTILS